MLYTTRNLLKKPEGTDSSLISDITDNFDTIDAMISKCNFAALADPTINDDIGDDYIVGSQWYNIQDNKMFSCMDNTLGAAVWIQTNVGGSNLDIGNYQLRAQTFYVDVTTGTKPITVVSTTLCDNLNADQLDGLHASSFLLADGSRAVSAALQLTHIATPAEPAASTTKLYAKSDGYLYKFANGGSEVNICDHGSMTGLGDDDHTQYIKHALSTAGNDFLVGSGSNTFIKKTLAETQTILGIVSSNWTALSAFLGTPASTSKITTTSDLTGTLKVGMPLKYKISTTYYYGIITAITTNLITIAGAPLSDTITELYYGLPSRVAQIDFVIIGTFADAANTGLLASDGKTKFRWGLQKAYCVQINHTVRVDDTGANQPRVTISIAGSVVGTSNTNAGEAVAETWTSTVVGINVSNYDINQGEAIEIVTDANGSNDDATDLTLSAIFVLE